MSQPEGAPQGLIWDNLNNKINNDSVLEFFRETEPIGYRYEGIQYKQWSPTSLALGTGFLEDNFSTTGGGDGFQRFKHSTCIVHSISIIITSASPQSIRHQIWEVGHPGYQEFLHAIMEVEKSHYVPSASWRPRKAVVQLLLNLKTRKQGWPRTKDLWPAQGIR